MTNYLRTFVTLCLVAVICIVFMDIFPFKVGHKFLINIIKMDKGYAANHLLFVVDTPVCQIPDADPNDVSLLHVLKPNDYIDCKQRIPLTYRNVTTLHVNWTAVMSSEFKKTFHACRYHPIYRPLKGTNHNYFQYLNGSKMFNTSIHVKHEFVRVTCFDLRQNLIYTNFYAIVIEKKHVKDRITKILKSGNPGTKRSEIPSILMLGTDSTSRLNSIRYMSKTRLYLLRELGSFELLGYNKVGRNTFPNIVPMTTGKHLRELPWNVSMSRQPLDRYNFIWKNYMDRGYRTLFTEDDPSIAIFDYLIAGFSDIPTDYFNRPLSVAMDRDRNIWHSNKFCAMERTESEISLDYITQFVSKFHENPYFVFSFLTKITHDSVSLAAFIDDLYFKFLKQLNENGYLRNTIIFFFGDHGIRYGAIRNTDIGSLEDRMPMMHVAVPKRILNMYPHITRNLEFNTVKLTTPFDVYETLQDILNFTGEEKRVPVANRGVSLFSKVSEMRNCSTSGIPIEYCSCAQFEEISCNTETGNIMSKLVVEELNHQLEGSFSLCHRLELDKIVSITKRKPVEKTRHVTKLEYYGIKITTKPGNAIFEAIIEYGTTGKSGKLVGDINRVNAYGQQSDCIQQRILKNFCFCRDQ